MVESQAYTQLAENVFDDPSQLSQLLQQRATGSDKAFHFTTSTASHQSGYPASAPATASAEEWLRHPTEALLQHSATARQPNVPSPRRVSSTRHVIPALPVSHSAPTSTGVVLEREGARKMHHSFAFGGVDAPGDTQPDSQLHRQYTSSTRHDELSSRLLAAKSLFTEHTEDDEDGDVLSEVSEVVESSQERVSLAITSPTMIHEDESPGPEEMHIYAPTSPLKFQTPRVPHQKGGSSGQLLSSAVRTNTTPDTVASASVFQGLFNNGGVTTMSLTQAYNNTQAPTSPAALEPSDDVAFTRPSPNFSHIRPTSPLPALSSPSKAARPGTPLSDPPLRSSSEPRAEYESIKESQDRRRRKQREVPAPALEHEDSWEQPSAAQLRAQKIKAREMQERRAAMDLANVSAPSPTSPQRGRKRTIHHEAMTPRPSRSSRRTKSDPENSSTITKSTRKFVEIPNIDGSHSQEVPFTTPAPINGSGENVQVPQTSSHAPRNSNNSHNASPSRTYPQSQSEKSTTRTLWNDIRLASSKDSVAIMDSQPETTADYDSIPRPKSLRFPSSPSINAYSINQTTMGKTGYTSQVISSSMPPLPPQSSPDEAEIAGDGDDQLLGGERVPSSPPIVAHEDDLTYDGHEHEHAYDEYAGEQDIHNSVEPHTPGHDVMIEDEEDHSGAKEELNELENAKHDERTDPNDLDLVDHDKANASTDQEVEETLDTISGSGTAVPQTKISVAHAPALPRMQRQDTVPETDAVDETQASAFPADNTAVSLDETQPSLFAVDDSGMQVDRTDAILADTRDEVNETDSTERFHTAREELSGSQAKRPIPASSTEGGSSAIQPGDRLRSLDDLANIPMTQQSHAEEEFEMPRLSGLDENSEEVSLQGSSPARPAKRRKVTYTAKRGAFRSPAKPQQTFEPTPEIGDNLAHANATRAEVAAGEADDTTEAPVPDDSELPIRKAATLKSKAPQKQSKKGKKKAGTLKTITKELLQSLSSPHRSPGRLHRNEHSRPQTPVTPSRSRIVTNERGDDVDMVDADHGNDTTDVPSHVQPGVVDVPNAAERDGDFATANLILPNRVLASWPGSHYYPATCLGKVTGRQMQIRFDDGNTTSLEAVHIRILDLRPGDQVKVDEIGMKKHTYVVVGLRDRISIKDDEYPVTDCRGHATVVLEEKQRDSMPAPKTVQAPKHVSVPVGSIYLTAQLWARYRNRSLHFSPPASPSKSTSGLGTPIISTEAALTPSFARKSIMAPSLLRDATARGVSVASSSARLGSGTFNNMAFVLTSTAADIDKEAIARLVRINGGLILEDGFHELFDLERSEATPSSQSRRSSSQELDGLYLKQQCRHLGFVALISDSHSRSTKYIQALALNVPCLHSRWVNDSLTAGRVVPFARYLLPAGVSKFLDPNGVVRSRTMATYDPSTDDVAFASSVSQRELLLRDQSVMLVTGKCKKEIERRQPFVFLTHALGAANVGRCADLAAAQEALADEQWDWVYVDNGEQGVVDAAAELFGTGKPATSTKTKKTKKRKRDATEEREELVARGIVAGRNVKITSSEFVIQSLILGALVQ